MNKATRCFILTTLLIGTSMNTGCQTMKSHMQKIAFWKSPGPPQSELAQRQIKPPSETATVLDESNADVNATRSPFGPKLPAQATQPKTELASHTSNSGSIPSAFGRKPYSTEPPHSTAPNPRTNQLANFDTLENFNTQPKPKSEFRNPALHTEGNSFQPKTELANVDRKFPATSAPSYKDLNTALQGKSVDQLAANFQANELDAAARNGQGLEALSNSGFEPSKNNGFAPNPPANSNANRMAAFEQAVQTAAKKTPAFTPNRTPPTPPSSPTKYPSTKFNSFQTKASPAVYQTGPNEQRDTNIAQVSTLEELKTTKPKLPPTLSVSALNRPSTSYAPGSTGGKNRMSSHQNKSSFGVSFK